MCASYPEEAADFPRSVSVLEIASVEGTADVSTIVEAFRFSGYERADSHTDHVASLR
jgi:hypothetical protein